MKKFQKVERLASSGTTTFARCGNKLPPGGCCGTNGEYKAH